MTRAREGAHDAAEDARGLTVKATRLEEAGRAARRAGDYATARARFETAIAMLGDDHSAWRTRLHIQLSRMLGLSGDRDASLREAERAVCITPPGASESVALARLAVALSHAGRAVDAQTSAQRAVEAALHAGDLEAEGIARMALGYALRSAGMPLAASQEVGAAVPLAAAHGDHEAVVTRLIDLANSLYLAGDGAAAAEAAARSVAEARRRGVALGMPAAAHALFLYHTGRWQSAMRVLDDGLAEEPRFPWLVLMRAQLLVGRGDLAAARRSLARAERLAPGPRAGGWDGPQETAADLLLWADDPAGALARVQEALATVEVTERNDTVRELAVLGLRALADMREAGHQEVLGRWQGVADRLIDLVRRHGALMREGHPEAVGGHLPAMEALAEAEYARAHGLVSARHWHRAAELLDGIGNPWRSAYARLRLAQAARRDGDSSADAVAAAALADAHRTAVRLRARLLQRMVESEASAWGRPILAVDPPLPAATAPRDPRGLTPRERQVLALLGNGSNNRQIASALGISEKTVSVHIGSITGKLGVGNRLEAAAIAMRLSPTPDGP
ncbi:MAG TPA: helix-turn-helix transcriptional regulator [Candidatus Limnocylindria bacterium]